MQKTGQHGAILFDQPSATGPRTQYLGTYRTWEPKVRFGRHLPVPRIESKTVWAESQAAAEVQLGRWMTAHGFALGGLLSCKPVKNRIVNR